MKAHPTPSKKLKSIPLAFSIAGLVWLSLFLVPVSQGQLALRVLHSFTGGGEGQQPYAGLIQGTDGRLYGTTFQGGSNNAGVVFRVNPDGSGNSVVLSFPANPIDPGGVANPCGLVQGTDGALYGTSGFGGANGYGAVFKLSPDGSAYTVLHSFDSTLGGPYEPTAALVQGADGLLYGTTQFGGVPGHGSVFKISTNGTQCFTLHEFGIGSDGQSPQAPLLQGLDGALYGTTALGGTTAQGGASGYGTVFKLATDGSAETVLHSFTGAGGDGQDPYTAGLVQDRSGTLYGITQQGGSAGLGVVFSLKTDGSGFTILHHFGGAPADGRYPNAALILSADGTLYGTTEWGGANDAGTVFRLNIDGSGYSVLYSFGSRSSDGRFPGAPLVQASDGGLFGTTKFGGDNNLGTVFRLAPAAPVISSLALLPDKTVKLTIQAAPNFVFRIDGTSDHVHWVTLTNILNGKSSLEFIDFAASNTPSRLYRAAWVP